MAKINHLTVVLVAAITAATGVFWFREHRSKSLYVEWLDNGVIAGLQIASLSGGDFSIHDITVDGVFRPTLTTRQPGRNELWSELTYPIHMSPPCSVVAVMRVTDLGDEDVNGRCYRVRPKSVLIRSDRGEFRFSITKE